MSRQEQKQEQEPSGQMPQPASWHETRRQLLRMLGASFIGGAVALTAQDVSDRTQSREVAGVTLDETSRLIDAGLSDCIDLYRHEKAMYEAYGATPFFSVFRALWEVAQQTLKAQDTEGITDILASEVWGTRWKDASQAAADWIAGMSVTYNEGVTPAPAVLNDVMHRVAAVFPAVMLALPNHLQIAEHGGWAMQDVTEISLDDHSTVTLLHEGTHQVENPTHWDRIAPYVDQKLFLRYLETVSQSISVLLPFWLSLEAPKREDWPFFLDISESAPASYWIKRVRGWEKAFLSQAEQKALDAITDRTVADRFFALAHTVLKRHAIEREPLRNDQEDDYREVSGLLLWAFRHYLVGPVQKVGLGLPNDLGEVPEMPLSYANLLVQQARIAALSTISADVTLGEFHDLLLGKEVTVFAERERLLTETYGCRLLGEYQGLNEFAKTTYRMYELPTNPYLPDTAFFFMDFATPFPVTDEHHVYGWLVSVDKKLYDPDLAKRKSAIDTQLPDDLKGQVVANVELSEGTFLHVTVDGTRGEDGAFFTYINEENQSGRMNELWEPMQEIRNTYRLSQMKNALGIVSNLQSLDMNFASNGGVLTQGPVVTLDLVEKAGDAFYPMYVEFPIPKSLPPDEPAMSGLLLTRGYDATMLLGGVNEPMLLRAKDSVMFEVISSDNLKFPVLEHTGSPQEFILQTVYGSITPAFNLHIRLSPQDAQKLRELSKQYPQFSPELAGDAQFVVYNVTAVRRYPYLFYFLTARVMAMGSTWDSQLELLPLEKISWEGVSGTYYPGE